MTTTKDILVDGIAVNLTAEDAVRLGVRRMVGLGYYAGRGIAVTWDYLDGRAEAEICADGDGSDESLDREVEAANADPEAYALQMVEAGVERDRALAEAEAA